MLLFLYLATQNIIMVAKWPFKKSACLYKSKSCHKQLKYWIIMFQHKYQPFSYYIMLFFHWWLLQGGGAIFPMRVQNILGYFTRGNLSFLGCRIPCNTSSAVLGYGSIVQTMMCVFIELCRAGKASSLARMPTTDGPRRSREVRIINVNWGVLLNEYRNILCYSIPICKKLVHLHCQIIHALIVVIVLPEKCPFTTITKV